MIEVNRNETQNRNQTTKTRNLTIRKNRGILDTIGAVLLNTESLNNFFQANDIQKKIDEANSKKTKHAKYQAFTALAKLARAYQEANGGRLQVSELSDLNQVSLENKLATGGFELLKLIAKGFNAVDEDEDGDDSDDDEAGSEEEQDDILETFQKINEQSKELRETLHSIKPEKLAKFLTLKVSQDSPLYTPIEAVRYTLSLALDEPIKSIKFKTSNLVKLYIGLPFYAIKNKKRLDFIEWVNNQDWPDYEEDDEEEETEALKVAKKLSKWFNDIKDLFEVIKDTDLDQIKKKTVDQDYAEIRNFQCENIKWLYAPLTQDCDVTLVSMNNICELGSRMYAVSIIINDHLIQFENVQVSSFLSTQSLTYKAIRVNLSEYCAIPNSQYIIVRPFSLKSAIYVEETSLVDDEFLNDCICYYSVSIDDHQDILNRIKDFLFIKVTDAFVFVLVLDLSKTLNEQVEAFTNKLKEHSLVYSNEEIKHQLTWNGKKVDWSKEFNHFTDMNDKSHLGKVGVMFSLIKAPDQRPVYRSDPNDKDINMKMKVGEVMSHYYSLGYEEYSKQGFNLNAFGSTLLGFDISSFSSKFDFCENFSFKMAKIDKLNDQNDQVHFYRVFAVLLKRETAGGSKLFLYNPETQEFFSASNDETLSKEQIGASYVDNVWFLNDSNAEDDGESYGGEEEEDED